MMLSACDSPIAEEVVMGEVMYRTVFFFAAEHTQCRLAIQMAKDRGLYGGSCTGIGFNTLDLVATPGEAANFGRDLRDAGIPCRVITESDAPRRPHTWAEPVMRPNWPAVA